MHRLFPLLLLLFLIGCGRSESTKTITDPFAGGHYKLGSPYTIKGQTYVPEHDPTYDEIGIASWYGDAFHAKATANGERFDKTRLTAAHKTLALPSIVRVTNIDNGKSITVRVNDRGPFVDDRIIDLSEAAASVLGFRRDGLAKVRVQYLRLADSSGRRPQPTKSARLEQAPVDRFKTTGSQTVDEVDQIECNIPVHFVQIGAFQDALRAQAVVERAHALGFSSMSLDENPSNRIFRVRFGPLASLTEAEKSRIRLRATGFDSSLIVNERSTNVDCS